MVRACKQHMAEPGPFRDLQLALAAHIRDPVSEPAPAKIEDRRLAIYRDLFFSNISGLLAGTYPVTKDILGQDKWKDLVRDYFSRHKSHTPYFLEVSRDFLTYLEQDRGEVAGDPPFLLELAHYEWVELALSVADAPLPEADPDGDLLAEPLVLSPLHQVLCYRFPVHRIGPDFQPQSPPEAPTWLVVARDREDRVSFLSINEVTARLLALAAESSRSGMDLLRAIAQEMPQAQPEKVIDGGKDLLRLLFEKHIILGTRISNKQD